MVVSRLGKPVNTTTRMLLVLPPAIGYHEGFAESIYLIKRLAENLGVGIEAIAVGDQPSAARYEELVDSVDPEMDVPVDTVSDWPELRDHLSAANPSDLVVPLKPREGGIGWAPDLRRLPEYIIEAPPEAFVVVTPRQDEPGYAARFLRID